MLNEKQKIEEKLKNRQEFFVDMEVKILNQLSDKEFKEYIAELLIKIGYKIIGIEPTQNNDVDIIAEKEKKIYAFKVLKSRILVDNKPIQQIYYAKKVENFDNAIVITNSLFEEQVVKEAEMHEVELWNIEKVKEFICFAYNFELERIDIIKNNIKNSLDREEEEDETDSLLMEAIDIVVETGQASTSFIQRRFKVGYARAGKIIDQLEERGIISGYLGSKPREVLMPKERWEELKMQQSRRRIEKN